MRELRIELMRSLMAGLTSDELAALRDGIAALDREAQHLVVPSPSPVAQTERTPA